MESHDLVDRFFIIFFLDKSITFLNAFIVILSGDILGVILEMFILCKSTYKIIYRLLCMLRSDECYSHILNLYMTAFIGCLIILGCLYSDCYLNLYVFIVLLNNFRLG